MLFRRYLFFVASHITFSSAIPVPVDDELLTLAGREPSGLFHLYCRPRSHTYYLSFETEFDFDNVLLIYQPNRQ